MSIIIPTLNEANNLKVLLPHLKKYIDQKKVEILIVDAESEDESGRIAAQNDITFLQGSHKGRSCQMHFGAEQAKGDILYFVHADVRPPATFYQDICKALNQGYVAGCFSYQFDQSSLLLRFNAFMTRIPSGAIGGGDQTLFITKKVYNDMGGFNTDLCIMEDFEFVKRIKAKHPFYIVKCDAVVSARKYENNSWLRVQLANTYIFLAYKLGASQDYLFKTYRSLLH